MSTLTENRKNELDALAAEIDAVALQAREYNESDTCGHAEFCQTFGYGNDKPSLDNLDDDVAVKVNSLKRATGKGFKEALASVCTLELTTPFTLHNEVYSVCLGEIEEQLPDDLANQVKSLNAEEQQYLCRELSEACLGHNCTDCIYINMDYQRWVLVIDDNAMDEKLAELNIIVEPVA